MNIKCILGFHKWEGCKCSACGKTRDQDHDWSKDCEKCARCGASRANNHQWNGCKCSACGKEQHQRADGKCVKCGKHLMSKSDLPDKLFIPSLRVTQGQLQGGHIKFQLRDDEGGIAIPAWHCGELVTIWLQEGLELCKRNDNSIEHNITKGKCEVVVVIEDTAEFFETVKTGSYGRIRSELHFEPDLGNIFSPPERRIPLV
jgi:hypothetical protein